MTKLNSVEAQTFLKILRAVVKDIPLLDDNSPSLETTAEQWKEVFKMAREHNLLPLILEKATEDPIVTQLPEFNEYLRQTVISVARQEERTKAFLKLYQAFIQEGVQPIVVKGLICRQIYGSLQYHRVSSDEDILVRKEDYRQMATILRQQGFMTKDEEPTEEQLEKLKEISFYDTASGLSVDVHINPFGYTREWKRRSNACFSHVFEQYREVEIDGVTVRTMSHTDHLLFLILHALKHLWNSGVGIRQVMDILLYMREYGGECDWKYLHKILEEQKAKGFLSDCIYIGNRYLGFEINAFYEATCPEELLEDILQCGAFGNSAPVQQMAGEVANIAIVQGKGREKSWLWMFLIFAFPDKRCMADRFPKIVENQWLLPVYWAMRWWTFLKQWKKGGVKFPVEGMKRGRRRVEFLKKYMYGMI